jgi:CYTH domain-containing protein
MKIEIERRYLVNKAKIQPLLQNLKGIEIIQGCLSTAQDRLVMSVRKTSKANQLRIKSPKVNGVGTELELEVNLGEADSLLKMVLGHPIEKDRYKLNGTDGLEWVVDVFKGHLDGLVIAEIELDSADQVFEKPEWLEEEITENKSYNNSKLALEGLPQLDKN